MTLQNIAQLEADLQKAAKSRDEIRLTVLRLLKSALKYYEIEVGHDATPQEILTILQKEAKKRRDSIEQYSAANRQDLVTEETKELDILQSYLPEEMSDSKLDETINQAIKETGATNQADMGRVMQLVMKNSAGQVDGARVSAKVKSILQK